MTFCTLTLLLKVGLFAFLGLHSLSAQSQQREWWFEIEVVLFQRTLATTDVSEAFDPSFHLINTKGSRDIITPYLQPDLTAWRDALPYCVQDVNKGNPFFDAQHYLSDLHENIELATVTEDVEVLDEYDADLMFNELTQDQILNQPSDVETDFLFPVAEELSEFSLPPPPESQSESHGLEPELIEDANFILRIDCVRREEQYVLNSPFEALPETPILAEVPTTLDGTEWVYRDGDHLLSEDSLQLKDLVNDIQRQSGLAKLLHLGWRQQVLFGKDQALTYRLFGGRNYADSFDESGVRLLPSLEEASLDEMQEEEGEVSELFEQVEPDLISDIRLALADEQFQFHDLVDESQSQEQIRLTELWQIDGMFKVFLRYIKGTPYLHIDSELDFRAPAFSEIPAAELASSSQAEARLSGPDHLKVFTFKQLRRVISTQVHYFDHPLFGMVVQIRRYKRPESPVVEQSLPDTQ